MITVRRACTPGRATSALLAALMLAAASGLARGEPEAPSAQDADEQPLAARVRAVLEAHCPDCRAAHAEAGTLDLDALSRDPRLVVARRPDASRAYQRLLAAEAGADGAAAPAPAEIEAVRDWIESLPARDAGCRGLPLVTLADADAGIERWVEAVGPAEAADTRFVSLVHLWNACASPTELKDARAATTTLLAALARRREPPDLETLGDASAVLVVRLTALALQAADWDRLTAGAPLSGLDAVPADWLAARVLSRPKDRSDPIDPAFDGAGQIAVSALARTWSRDVDLLRAAAERGVPPRALAETLSQTDGEVLYPARRLLHGTLSRAAWDRLSRALDGHDGAPETEPVPASEIDVLLWADKAFYRPRDLVAFRVRVSRACHLTLINVDQDGKATVLFPNELEPDNLIAPAVTVSVPGREAGYQLRFDQAGEETVVAICQRASRRPIGIAYDYERQRFALLGDWRTFLRTAPEREKAIRAREAAEAARRRRRGRSPAAPPPAIDPDGGAVEGRAAIYLAVDPGGAP